MALFGKGETINQVSRDDVSVPEYVLDLLPDHGEFFLGFMPGGEPREVVRELIDSVRHQNGCLPGSALEGIKFRDFKQGPLCLLALGQEALTLEVWGSYGLGGRSRRDIESGVRDVWYTQGPAAAASWAMASRPGNRFDVEFLASQLRDTQNQSYEWLTNGDVIKAFKKWRR